MFVLFRKKLKLTKQVMKFAYFTFQVGCYVPAISAEFRITDWLFSRIGFDDSIEHNASSFMLEVNKYLESFKLVF